MAVAPSPLLFGPLPWKRCIVAYTALKGSSRNFAGLEANATNPKSIWSWRCLRTKDGGLQHLPRSVVDEDHG